MDSDTGLTLIRKIKTIKHPTINHILFNLGILKNIESKDGTIEITMAFPFPNIPIADQLIASVCNPIKEKGFDFTVETTVMNPDEGQRFLQMEQQAWIR